MSFLPDAATTLAFAFAAALLAVTPGPDMTISVSRALSDGRPAGIACVLGATLGIVVHTMLVAFGVSALLTASVTAFFLLKAGGALYLLWLAWQAIRHGSSFNPVAASGGRRRSIAVNFLQGLGVNLLNPKVIIFFMTFLPQFVSAHDPDVRGKLIFLGLLFVAVSLPIVIAIVLVAHGLSAALRRNPRIMRGLDYTIAGVFSAFALKILATQAR